MLFMALAIFSLNMLLSQNPKRQIIYFNGWNYPTVDIPETKLSLVFNEKPLSVPLYIKGKKAIPNVGTSKNEISPEVLERLNFRTFQLVANSEAEVVLTITPLPSRFSVDVKENSSLSSGQKATTYKGELNYLYGTNVTLATQNGEILYEETFNQVRNLYNISAYNNFGITSIDLATDLVVKEFESQSNLYIERALPYSAEYEAADKLILAIDYQRIDKILALYSFSKSKKDPNLELVNTSVEEIKTQLDALEDTEDYQTKLKETLLPHIEMWKSLLPNYDKTDRKQQKIYWGLVANISGAYYAFGAYDNALEAYNLLQGVKYRDDHTYLKELPEEQMALVNTPRNKDFKAINFSGTHNPEFIVYANTEGLLSEATTEVELQKAKLLYNIFAVTGFYESFEDLERKFTKRDKSDQVYNRYKDSDKFLKAQVNRIYGLTKEIENMDVSIYTEDQKFLIAEVKQNIHYLIGKTIGKFEQKDNDPNKSEISIIVDELKEIMTEDILGTVDEQREDIKAELDSSLRELKLELMVHNTWVLNHLPYFDFLIDELTTEGKLSFAENPELYQAIYKDYKELYHKTMLKKHELLSYLHHTEAPKVEALIDDYYTKLYFAENIESLNENFKNIYNPEIGINILSTFVKK